MSFESLIVRQTFGETAQGKEIDLVAGLFFQSQTGTNLADDRRELEAVAGEPPAQNEAAMTGMAGDHKMTVRGQRVRTRLRGAACCAGAGHPLLYRLGNRVDISHAIDLTVEMTG